MNKKYILLALILALAGTVCAKNWTYDSSAKTISDGQWTLSVTLKDTVLSVWGVKSHEDGGDGVIDLNNPLKLERGTNITVSGVVFGENSFSMDNKNNTIEKSALKKFYCDIVDRLGGAMLQGNTNLTDVVLKGEKVSVLPGLMLNKCNSLTNAVLKFPNLRTLGDRIFGKETTKVAPINVMDLLNPGVTNITSKLTQDKGSSFFYGDLVLTNIHVISELSFRGADLRNVRLAGPLASLGFYTFHGYGITNIVLALPHLAVVNIEAFNSQKRIHSLEMQRVPKGGMGLVSNILAYAASGASANDWVNGIAGLGGWYNDSGWKPQTNRIYVSRKQWTPSAEETWSPSNTNGFFLGKPFTEGEKKMIEADPTLTKAFGVWVQYQGTNLVHRAFFVHKPSPYDKLGFVLHFR
mgnify:CR=1 FL=1